MNNVRNSKLFFLVLKHFDRANFFNSSPHTRLRSWVRYSFLFAIFCVCFFAFLTHLLILFFFFLLLHHCSCLSLYLGFPAAHHILFFTHHRIFYQHLHTSHLYPEKQWVASSALPRMIPFIPFSSATVPGPSGLTLFDLPSFLHLQIPNRRQCSG